MTYTTSLPVICRWGIKYLHDGHGFFPANFAYKSFKLMDLTNLFGSWVKSGERGFGNAVNGSPVLRFGASLIRLQKAFNPPKSTTLWAQRIEILKQASRTASLAVYTVLSFAGGEIWKRRGTWSLLVSNGISLYAECEELREIYSCGQTPQTVKTWRMLKICQAVIAIAFCIFTLHIASAFALSQIVIEVVQAVGSLFTSGLIMYADYYDHSRGLKQYRKNPSGPSALPVSDPKATTASSRQVEKPLLMPQKQQVTDSSSSLSSSSPSPESNGFILGGADTAPNQEGSSTSPLNSSPSSSSCSNSSSSNASPSSSSPSNSSHSKLSPSNLPRSNSPGIAKQKSRRGPLYVRTRNAPRLPVRLYGSKADAKKLLNKWHQSLKENSPSTEPT